MGAAGRAAHRRCRAAAGLAKPETKADRMAARCLAGSSPHAGKGRPIGRIAQMASYGISRRSVFSGLLCGAGLAALGRTPAQAQTELRLRMFWWGSKERAERTDKVNQLY